MGLDENLKKQLAAFGKSEIQVISGVVKSVDLDKSTAVVNADGIDYSNVRLTANIDDKFGFLVVPKIGTEVLINFIGDSINQSYVVSVNEVEKIQIKTASMKLYVFGDKITINGDAFGGLVKAPELKTQVDKNTAVLEALQNAISAFTPVPNDGGAAWKASASSLISMQVADLSNIENDNVKHG